MTSLHRGLYHSLITDALERRLRQLEATLHKNVSVLHAADVADRIAMHLAGVIERAIEQLDDRQRVTQGLALARTLVEQSVAATGADDLMGERPSTSGGYLNAILARLPDGSPEPLSQPLIPLLDTVLLTNALGEPRVGHQIGAEIPSADRIDVVMAFIRRSGIRPLLDDLRRHCDAGRSLRVLTTVYTGSTEAEALDELRRLGADVRVSYDGSSTRLHAKAWLFHRASGFSTAYIGSSNLTHSAQVSGVEWNARFSAARNAPVVAKVSAVFDAYWHSGDFVPYDPEQFRAAMKAPVDDGNNILLPFEIRLDPFQERLLEQIALSRLRGYHRNLLVSATGTGKTVMAAMDYMTLRERFARARLLFVAHRAEILKQARGTFRQAMRDTAFGELWVDGQHPSRFEHVFASIQSLNAAGLLQLDPAHFDVVIVDEFHHAEAPSYRALLDHLKPQELLGLTATPERGDGQDLLHWFDGRIAAELRLWDAIDQHRLVPFVYHGISDDLDYTQIPWRRGRGYDADGLSGLVTGNDAWARKVIDAMLKRIDSPERMRALGFCVSVDHARFMARKFNEHGIRATAIWADTARAEREQALRDLEAGRVNVVFSVDLFNEGVDVPKVDTLLMLRPTDSATLFLQQLGRGLRRARQKTYCTVLDFIGLHRKEFRFDRRMGALLNGTRQQLTAQVEAGFPYLPAGCHMEMDRVASERVIANIKAAIPSTWTRKVEELRQVAAGGGDPSLASFLAATGMSLEDVYASNRGWSDLREAAGLPVRASGPAEAELRRAIGRMLHVDDLPRIDAYSDALRRLRAQGVSGSLRDQRHVRMLAASLAGAAAGADASVQAACDLIGRHPQVIAELLELLDVLRSRVSHVPLPLAGWPNVPLLVHAQYSRIEIQAGFGDGSHARVPTWREGVKWIEAENCDVFVVTRIKNDAYFSERTRYKDCAISRDLFQWESQSTTPEDSPTGLRYRACLGAGPRVMLFARKTVDDRAFLFLGPASYVSHDGERPMRVRWRLETAMPGDVHAWLAAAVA